MQASSLDTPSGLIRDRGESGIRALHPDAPPGLESREALREICQIRFHGPLCAWWATQDTA